ncbi:unnamed protein product [Parajaminaea phylloscopi]
MPRQIIMSDSSDEEMLPPKPETMRQRTVLGAKRLNEPIGGGRGVAADDSSDTENRVGTRAAKPLVQSKLCFAAPVSAPSNAPLSAPLSALVKAPVKAPATAAPSGSGSTATPGPSAARTSAPKVFKETLEDVRRQWGSLSEQTLTSPTFQSAMLPVAREAADPRILVHRLVKREYWGNSPGYDVILQYCRMLARLQLILAKISIQQGSSTLNGWQQLLTPFLASTSLNRVWREAIDTSVNWKSSSSEKRVRLIFSRLADLDVEEAIERLNTSKQHPSVAAAIAAAQTGDATSAQTPFPSFLFPAAPLQNLGDGGVDGQLAHKCQKDLLQKADQLRLAIRSRGPQEAKSALQASYSLWPLRHIMRGLLYFDSSKTLREQQTELFSREQLVDILVDKWAPLEKPVRDTKRSDLLSVEDERRIADEATKKSTAMKPKMDKYKIEGHDGTLRVREAKISRRHYVRMRVNAATYRSGVTVGEHGRAAFDQLHSQILQECEPAMLEEEVHCEYCNHVLCFQGAMLKDPDAVFEEGREKHPFNLSLDRRIPGSKGGTYLGGNIAFTCVGCNLCKMWMGKAHWLSVLETLRQATYSVDTAGFLRPREPLKTIQPTRGEEHNACAKWSKAAARRADEAGKAKERKKSSLSQQDCFELLTRVYVGGGNFQDISGVVLPIEFASIDRIDPKGRYEMGNVRVIFSGFNLLRSDAPDDSSIQMWLDGIAATGSGDQVQ